MKKFLFFALAASLFFSCSSDTKELSGEKAAIYLGASINSDITIEQVRATPTDNLSSYYVTITGPTNVGTIQWPANGLVPDLDPGTYTVTVASHNAVPAPAFDTQYYKGTNTVTLDAGETKTVDITCELANTGVLFFFDPSLEGTEFEGVIPSVAQGSTTLVYEDEDREETGYFAAGTSVQVRLKNEDNEGLLIGDEEFQSFTPQAGKLYRVTLYTGELTGGSISLNVTVNEITTPNETISWVVSESGETPEDPEFPTEVVKINPGTFQMGARAGLGFSYERPRHWVKITKEFYMGKYPITNKQFSEFLNDMGVQPIGDVGVMPHTAPSNYAGKTMLSKTMAMDFPNGIKYYNLRGEWGPSDEDGRDWSDCPAVFISYWGAAAFAEWIGEGARIPTEAEWEYACRAGNMGDYLTPSGTSAEFADYAWCMENNSVAYEFTKPVGTKLPNDWGLYDMMGNVYEWCVDSLNEESYNPGYQTGVGATEETALVDPCYIHSSGDSHPKVIRGGSYGLDIRACYTAARGSLSPDVCVFSDMGFRLAYDAK